MDFTDLNVCIDCIKGKQTKHTKKGATRSSQLLEIIHTDICGPFDIPSFNKEKNFITFIDDFSRYGFVYLLNEKSQSVEAFEEFINEVETESISENTYNYFLERLFFFSVWHFMYNSKFF